MSADSPSRSRRVAATPMEPRPKRRHARRSKAAEPRQGSMSRWREARSSTSSLLRREPAPPLAWESVRHAPCRYRLAARVVRLRRSLLPRLKARGDCDLQHRLEHDGHVPVRQFWRARESAQSVLHQRAGRLFRARLAVAPLRLVPRHGCKRVSRSGLAGTIQVTAFRWRIDLTVYP